jgi:phosphoglycerate dehydrogenase-like enzyme
MDEPFPSSCGHSVTHVIEVLVIHPMADADLARIAAIDPRIHVVDARGWFDEELRESWPLWTVNRYIGNRPCPPSSRLERDWLLAKAEIIFGGWPFPLDLRARAPRLRWFHQRPAGASNLLPGDLWGSHVIVTTSRGHASIRPIAEYVLGCFMHFARGLHLAYRDQKLHRFDHTAYHPLLLMGKTACVVGTGGIGSEVGKLCAGIGMRVVGVRHRVLPGAALPIAFSRIEGPEHLHELLRESEFVAICCQWTPESNKMIDAAAFASMRPETVLVNVARGEIVDEEALIAALNAGKLRGVGLDVYIGEFERPPDRRLWENERVLITPHVSGGTDLPQHGFLDLFCENLRAYLEGRPLSNVIDWERGY